MSNRSETSFSAREMRYLQSLPAVEHVTQKRIRYTKAFRKECMRRYHNGESPVRIFRSAGLDSSLIGYKRIERCFSRWRADELKGGGTKSDDDDNMFDIAPSERWVGAGTPPVADGRYDRERDLALDTAVQGAYELVILQQARRIDELEHLIKELRGRIERLTAADELSDVESEGAAVLAS